MAAVPVRLVVGWSRKRAKKDAADRKKAVDKLVRKLGRSEISGAIARLEVDEDKITELSELFALSPGGARSDRELRRVEESFRITKHDLKVRPVFHWKPDRVMAHIAIAYMAFACVRHLACRIALRQGERMSPERIRTALASRQCSIVRDTRSKRRYALPSKTTPDMDRSAGPWGCRCPARPIGSNEAAGNSLKNMHCLKFRRKHAKTSGWQNKLEVRQDLFPHSAPSIAVSDRHLSMDPSKLA